MSTMSLHCQNRVQRLRGFGGDTLWSSGSRGLAPGILRSLLSLCCSNPRRGYVSPVDCVLARLPVRLCECEPWVISSMKNAGVSNHSEIPAKIAAFQGQALSRTHYFLNIIACWLGARTGTFPPLSFHGPPEGPHPPIHLRRWLRRTGPSLSNFVGEGTISHVPSPTLLLEKVARRAG